MAAYSTVWCLKWQLEGRWAVVNHNVRDKKPASWNQARVSGYLTQHTPQDLQKAKISSYAKRSLKPSPRSRVHITSDGLELACNFALGTTANDVVWRSFETTQMANIRKKNNFIITRWMLQDNRWTELFESTWILQFCGQIQTTEIQPSLQA